MAGEVRQKIDQEALEKYIKENVPEIKPPLELKQFGFGQSNPTYQLIDSNGKKTVLRKKPPGQLLSKTAHRIDREYRVLHALQDTDVPVPKTFCLCEDDSIIGTPFYIMDMVEGRFVENPAFPDVSEKERTEMWNDAVRTLAKLHRINPKDVGLEKFGKPSGFYNRQVKTFQQLGESQGEAKDKESGEPVGKLPHFDDFMEFFSQEKYQPKDRGTLYHGDYKIDNLIYHPTEPKVIGILDWEMSTVGHPLADLCNLIQPWTISNTTPDWPRIHGDKAFLPSSNKESTADQYPGLPSEQDVIKLYSETVGFDVPDEDLTWAKSFALFRDSIIFQGIAARYAQRQATSDSAQKYAAERKPFAEMAYGMVKAAKEKQGAQSKL